MQHNHGQDHYYFFMTKTINMKRKEFLKGLGLTSLAAIATPKVLAHSSQPLTPPPVCELVPPTTAGPFHHRSFTGIDDLWRVDMREDQPGVQFDIAIKVFGTDNCGILQNYRVDIWHCNATGSYSGYSTAQNGNHAGTQWLRGIQMTDENGIANFTTIFPGWYPGRVVHIHFEVYSGGTEGVSSGWALERTSQYTFPIEPKDAILTTHAPYSDGGADPLTPASDGLFSSNPTLQLATIEGDAPPYSSYYEFAIEASGVLPLKLLGFSGALKGQNAMLWWRTTSETNFSHFELEYGLDGEDYEVIATIQAIGKNNSDINEYMYEDLDRLIYGDAYYRLKMVDKDGNYRYSSKVVVTNNNERPLRVYPNPASDYLMLQHPLLSGKEKVLVLDVNRREVGLGQLQSGTEFTRIDLSLCQSGLHYLVFFDSGTTQIIKFLVTK